MRGKRFLQAGDNLSWKVQWDQFYNILSNKLWTHQISMQSKAMTS